MGVSWGFGDFVGMLEQVLIPAALNCDTVCHWLQGMCRRSLVVAIDEVCTYNSTEDATFC